MRARAALLGGTLLASAVWARPSRAEDPPATVAQSAESSAGEPRPEEVAAWRAESARQAQAIEQLRASVADEKRARENPTARVSGYVQIDWILHNQASVNEVDYAQNRPLNQDRFTLRRGHVRLDAERGLASAALELDANTTNGAQVRPLDANVSLRWPAKPEEGALFVVATLGLMKIPFGFEVPELDSVRPFLERASVMRALFPGEFDLGARIAGGYRFVQWGVALMNGSPVGDKVFPALAPSRTKDLVGRVGVSADVARGLRVEAGASAVTGLGFHEGSATSKDVLAWHDENADGIVQATEIEVIAGSAATASQTFRHFALGADLRVVVRIAPLGDLAIRAEIVRGQNLDRGLEYADPVGAGHDLRELGGYVGATQELTPWAMIGVRFDRYDPDQDASRQRAITVVPVDRSYTTLALMGMLRYEAARARLVFEYDRNGNALGRDAAGAPATLASDAVTVRGQVAF